jgi:nitrous oxidase accessory protein NosD
MLRLATSASRTLVGFLAVALCAVSGWVAAQRPVYAAAPSTILVDGSDATSDFGGCGTSANPCNTVQSGVDNASDRDTVSVAAGTFTEQVAIDKDITLDGNEAAVINAPAVMTGDKAILTIHGGARVTVANITISGPGSTNCGSLGFGIVVVGGAHADIHDSVITDIRDNPATGCQNGIGILVGRASIGETGTANIYRNQIVNFQKGGIVVDNAGSSAVIRENDIDGFGPVPFIAQNGIQVSRGAGAHVRDNDVDGSWFTGANWTSTGILIFESSGVIVQRNRLGGNQVGIDAEAWCWSVGSYAGLPASNNHIDGNTVEGSEYGIIVDAVDFPGYSACNPATNNNKLVNNILTSTPGTGIEGVFVGVYDGGSFAPRAVNNKVINNKISGFVTDVATEDDTGTKIHANRPAE